MYYKIIMLILNILNDSVKILFNFMYCTTKCIVYIMCVCIYIYIYTVYCNCHCKKYCWFNLKIEVTWLPVHWNGKLS